MLKTLNICTIGIIKIKSSLFRNMSGEVKLKTSELELCKVGSNQRLELRPPV